jgi:hypothetical protein
VPRRLLASTVVAVALLSACSSSSDDAATTTTTGGTAAASSLTMPSWPAPPDPMARARAAGLEPETAESLQHHVHSHLDVFVDGRAVPVPAGVGIDIHNPGVHTFGRGDRISYGGITEPCSSPCISPLHTHDRTGIVHTESATAENNTLGELFTEWAVRFDGSCVGSFCQPDVPISVYVNGKRVALDRAAATELTDQEEIAVVIGRPPAKVPASADFSAA